MFNKEDKNEIRLARHARVRKTVSGTAERPRLCVYRSLVAIYAQIIDDNTGNTLVSASSKEKDMLAKTAGKNKTQVAEIVGSEIATRAKAKKINAVVFDRGGYIYTGRIKALAEGARAAGLEF
ncbi:MAG: 50S ribosomal protein L18 [Clostridia bacterium]